MVAIKQVFHAMILKLMKKGAKKLLLQLQEKNAFMTALGQVINAMKIHGVVKILLLMNVEALHLVILKSNAV